MLSYICPPENLDHCCSFDSNCDVGMLAVMREAKKNGRTGNTGPLHDRAGQITK